MPKRADLPKRETESERTCIVTRRHNPPEAMIRFVCAPDGMIAPDIRARLPGRGVWVTARADLVAEAARKHMFARSLKTEVRASPALVDEVERLLAADCLQMLAMANKAGLVTVGFNKVSAALEKRAVAALIEAKDGGEDGKRKLAQAARRSAGEPAGTPKIVDLFDSAQLDLALGRTNVIHAALAAGGPATAFLTRCRRLAAYRGDVPVDEPESTIGDNARKSAEDATNLTRTGHVETQDRTLDE